MNDALRELLDKQALYELVATYCRACDRRDFALVRSLYHDDAIDDHGSMFRGGPDAYVAWLPQVMANFEATAHAVHNALFVVQGDHAQGELYTTAYHRTHSPGAQDIVIGGRYLDRYERRGDAWKFAHRSLTLDWCRIDPVNPAAYREFAAGAPPGRPDHTDPSYAALTFFRRLSP
jgi:ketosteroid isomerase-like protein